MPTIEEVPRQERANLWVTSAAQFLTLAGMTAVLPLLPLYLQQIGVTDRDALRYWTGILGSAPFAVAVFATPIWGALADRIGHKPMVVRSVIGIGTASVGMGLSSSAPALLGWRALQGAVSGVFPAAVSLLTALTPEVRVSRALAVLQSARAGGALCGPLIGGLLADSVGIRPLFFAVGGLAGASALACSLVLEESSQQRRAAAAAVQPGWRDLLKARPMVGMAALVTIFQTTVMASWPTLALFVEKLGVRADAVATTTGFVVFAAGLPAMLAATLWARMGERLGGGRMLVASLICTGAANLAIGLVSHLPLLFALRAVAGLSMAGFVPLAFDWMSRRSPPGARGRTAGLASTAMMLGNVIGPLLGGWLSVHVSLAATFWVPGAGLAVVGVVLAVAAASRQSSW